MVIFLEKLVFFISGLITLPFAIVLCLLNLLGILDGGSILLIYSIAGLEVWTTDENNNFEED